ncbi:MAG: Ig-like domain-containing protein, partial [Gaiellales bacterium]
YTANPGTGQGRKTPVTYRVTDVTGQTATSKLTPIVPPPPVAADDASRGPWSVAQTLAPLANDDTHLVASTLLLCDAGQTPPDCQATRVVVPEGVYEIVAGAVRFTPDPAFMSGAPTPIAYQSRDELGQLASAYLRPYVDSADPPVANPDASQGPWNQPQEIAILDNDTTGANVHIMASAARLCGLTEQAPACTLTDVQVPGQGTYALVGGSVRFTPEPGFVGPATPIAYRVEDSLGRVAHSTITVTVLPAPPTVTDETVTVTPGQAGTMTPTVTAGSAPINPALTCLAPYGADSCDPTSTLLATAEGVYQLDALTGTVTFTPAAGFTGTTQNPPSMCVTATDGLSDCGLLTPTVRAPQVLRGSPPRPPAPVPPINDTPGPLASPDFATTQVDAPITFALLLNDAAGRGQVLRPDTVQLRDPVSGAWATRVTVPGEGTYVVDAKSGAITFSPAAGYVGTAQRLAYRVRESGGAWADSTLQVRVVPVPPPYANPDYVMGPRGTALVLNALANDLTVGDAVFDPATLRLIDPRTGQPTTKVVVPGQGTYLVDGLTGTVRFISLRDFVGTATPVGYLVRTVDGRTVRSTLHPTIYGPAPRLRITTTSSVRLLAPGQRTVVTLRACNVGRATAVGSSVQVPLPAGMELRTAMGATVRGVRVASWATGRLRAGQCVTRSVTLVARIVGTVRLQGSVTAVNAARADDPARVRVVGSEALPSDVTG